MSPKLYFHPLSSYCHKALIAQYENDTLFQPVFVDLGDETSSALLRSLWPIAKFPVLHDEERGHTVAEATVIIEYLDTHYPGPTRLVPADGDLAWQTRMWDRFFDLYVHDPLQKVVGDSLRPAEARDSLGVSRAEAMLRKAYGMIDERMAGQTWMLGANYGLADCAASPSLFYANTIFPFDAGQRNLRAYFERLMTRPSYARVLEEAELDFGMFPLEPKPRREWPRA